MALHLLPRPLHYVETVARLGSIQAASRALGIAASAIDRQIILLEEAAQAPLFERQPKGMRPTAAGEAVVVMARRWRADVERITTELKQMQGLEAGHVRLAAMDSQADTILPEVVSRLGSDHPRIQLDVEILTPEGAAHTLDEGTADVALAFNLRPQRDFHVVWTETLPFGCVVGPDHPLAGEPSTTLREAARHPIAAQSRVLSSRQYIDQRHGWLFASSEPALVTNSLQLLKKVLREGRLLTLTSELDAAREIEDGDLVFVPLRDRSLAPQSISVAVNARRSLPRVARIVADIVVEVVSDRLARSRAAIERRVAATAAVS